MAFDLERRTTEFAKRVIRLCKALPRNAINARLISQAVGSAGSVGANYREANAPMATRMRPLMQEGIEIRNILSAIINKSI